MKTLGKKIRELRKQRGMTQHMLCEGLVTSSMISQIEADRAAPSAALLEELAKRLGVEPSYFEQDLSNKSDQLQNYRRARQLMERNQFAEALPLLQNVTFPLAPQFRADSVYNDLAHCYVQLGRLEDAARMYEAVVQTAYERDDTASAVHAYFHLGHVERRMNHPTVARMYWQRACDLLDRHPDLNMPIAVKLKANLGRLYIQEKKWLEAQQAYEQALELAQGFSISTDLGTVYQGLGYVYAELGDFDLALERNEQAIEFFTAANNDRGADQCCINRAVYLRRSGRVAESVEHLSEFINSRSSQRDHGRLANAYGELAQGHLSLGHLERALEDAAKAVNLDKDNRTLRIEMHLVKARALAAKGQFDQSLREVEAGFRLIGEDEPHYQAELQRVQRKCYLALGDTPKVLDKALEFATSVLEK